MKEKEAILAALKERGTNGLTTLEAVRIVGTTKLPTRAGELIAAGYPIKKEWAKVKTRRGETMVKRYTLAGE